jgi:hypothetical protein
LISFGFCVTNVSSERKVNIKNYVRDVPQYKSLKRRVYPVYGSEEVWNRMKVMIMIMTTMMMMMLMVVII